MQNSAVTRWLTLISVTLACSAESPGGISVPLGDAGTDAAQDAPFTTLCAPVARGCGLPNRGEWWTNSASRITNPADPRTAVARCGMRWECQYDTHDVPASKTRNWISCASGGGAPLPGMYLYLNFREPFADLPVGRTLQHGRDFTIIRMFVLEPNTVDPGEVDRYDAALPPAGVLTLTVLGPPVSAHPGSRVTPTMPHVSVRGQLCGAPLNLLSDSEIVDGN